MVSKEKFEVAPESKSKAFSPLSITITPLLIIFFICLFSGVFNYTFWNPESHNGRFGYTLFFISTLLLVFACLFASLAVIFDATSNRKYSARDFANPIFLLTLLAVVFSFWDRTYTETSGIKEKIITIELKDKDIKFRCSVGGSHPEMENDKKKNTLVETGRVEINLICSTYEQ